MITIRKATTEDLSILYEFEQGVLHAERPMDKTLTSPQGRERIEDRDSDQRASRCRTDAPVA